VGLSGPCFRPFEHCDDANLHLNATPFLIHGATNMKFRMDKTLRFWVNCSYEDKKYENANRPRAELIAEILREYERHGDAMRYLNANGRIAWKASPACFRNWPTPT
jgi:hypothetical protein